MGAEEKPMSGRSKPEVKRFKERREKRVQANSRANQMK